MNEAPNRLQFHVKGTWEINLNICRARGSTPGKRAANGKLYALVNSFPVKRRREERGAEGDGKTKHNCNSFSFWRSLTKWKKEKYSRRLGKKSLLWNCTPLNSAGELTTNYNPHGALGSLQVEDKMKERNEMWVSLRIYRLLATEARFESSCHLKLMGFVMMMIGMMRELWCGCDTLGV